MAETTNTPTLEGALIGLMLEAEWLAGNAVEMSDSAEPHDHYDPDEEPEQVVVNFGEMTDVRYKARRVLVLLRKIREAFPEQTKLVSVWCDDCNVHTDHATDEHAALLAAQSSEK